MWNKITNWFKIESLTTRIRLAFMSITFLLLFSGVMSMMELQRVGHDTEKILMTSKSNVELARDMIDALNKQHEAMMYMTVNGEAVSLHRTACEEGVKELSVNVDIAKEVVAKTEFPNSADSLIVCAHNINALSKNFINGDVIDEIERSFIIESENETNTLDRVVEDRVIAEDSIKSVQAAVRSEVNKWYIEVYQPEYSDMLRHITTYMTGVHNTLAPEVSNLSHTARRTVTPVFITLLVMIVIVLIFYFFMKLYVAKPIKRINKSLGNYLAYKTPFDDSINSRDEIRTLRDRIAALISKIR